MKYSLGAVGQIVLTLNIRRKLHLDFIMKSVKVTVFTTTSSEHGLNVGEVGPQDPSGESCADGSCDPTSSPGASSDEITRVKKCLDEVKTALGDSVRIEVMNYEDPSSVDRGMEVVNQALELAGTDPIESPERFMMFVNSSAPLFIIGNKIASTGVVPPSFQIISRVKANLRG